MIIELSDTLGFYHIWSIVKTKSPCDIIIAYYFFSVNSYSKKCDFPQGERVGKQTIMFIKRTAQNRFTQSKADVTYSVGLDYSTIQLHGVRTTLTSQISLKYKKICSAQEIESAVTLVWLQ